ncbi:MAG TPA: hypothetical protein DCS07_01835 [Bdellovibrionales bacterium]|nr:MAG: hypothetical protein A2X97_09500 [Bdellovibrionales bacterium GWA1_52_35]OFZ43298.1 MAG: hypothetical protein A2070_07680 [Bdellovibrionales bacterium GWC1_52_8]HAR41365.1 hypothetical protein [Bdellovibrionales bacterium]HCM40392.1 hypothetical protein [Bdellovibrionales bacterium]
MPKGLNRFRFVRVLLIAAFFTSGPAWGSSLDALREILNDPRLLQEPGAVQARAEELVAAYAPKYWFHADDTGPSDPIQFIADSSLWFKEPGKPDLMIAEQGKINPLELSRAWRNPGPARPNDSFTGAGLFLKLENIILPGNRSPAAPGAPSSRVVVNDWSRAPLLWRLGPKIRDDLFLIEYWFHSHFSQGGPLGIGDHEGDWEGVAALVHAEFTEPGIFAHRLVAMYFAAHEGGDWKCAEDLDWTQDETGRRIPEAYSARGSHATYSKSGRHWNYALLENAPRGKAWDTVKNLRPLTLEPYFGFSGGWGKTNRWAFMSGPMPPSSFKSMPGKSLLDRWIKVVEPICATRAESAVLREAPAQSP